MALTAQQSLDKYGTVAYTAWDEASAQADWNAKNGGGGGGGDANSILDNAVNSFSSLVKNIPNYDTQNPFSFDEALAREASTAQYSPYYQRLLTDYTQEVETKKARGTEDLKSTLEQLNAGKEYYTGVQRRALDKAERQTNEGYAGRGLFLSGVRGRDIEELRTESEAQTGNYLRGYDYNTSQAKLGEERSKVDLGTALSQYTRDTEESKKAAIESGVLQRRNEALDQYNIGKKDYYNTAFGTYA